MSEHDVSGEARDQRGRWTAGEGGTHTAPGMPLVVVDDPRNADQAKGIALVASRVANMLGFEPTAINVTDREHTFELNGAMHHAAGTASLATGAITLYMQQLMPSAIPGTVAHEIMHQKFESYMKAYLAERAHVMGDPQTLKDMRPDGTLQEPSASKYPLYQNYTTHFESKVITQPNGARISVAEKMAREDGVSEYSRSWWEAHKAGTATQNQAYHETLSEMARMNFDKTKLPGFEHLGKQKFAGPPTLKVNGFLTTTPSKDWSALYRAVEDHWKKRAKK